MYIIFRIYSLLQDWFKKYWFLPSPNTQIRLISLRLHPSQAQSSFIDSVTIKETVFSVYSLRVACTTKETKKLKVILIILCNMDFSFIWESVAEGLCIFIRSQHLVYFIQGSHLLCMDSIFLRVYWKK